MPLTDHPRRPTNPYPEPGTRIGRFEYRSALVLMRLKDAVRRRTGEDADYILARDFEVDWWPEGEEECRRLVAPAGLITDLTSVPPPFRWIVERVGPWLEAAILHDYLYVAWQDVPGRGARPSDRRFADDLMLAAMRAARVDPVRTSLIHGAVRAFGWGAYGRGNAVRYVDLTAPEVVAQLAFSLPSEFAHGPGPALIPAHRPPRTRPRDGSAQGGGA